MKHLSEARVENNINQHAVMDGHVMLCPLYHNHGPQLMPYGIEQGKVTQSSDYCIPGAIIIQDDRSLIQTGPRLPPTRGCGSVARDAPYSVLASSLRANRTPVLRSPLSLDRARQQRN